MPTFRPEAAVRERLRLLNGQVDAVIVVDDGSGTDYDATLRLIADDGHRVIRQDQNTGIAGALNAGCQAALDAGARYVLTLDQDTTLGRDYVEICVATFERAAVTRLALVCADTINDSPSLPESSTPEGFGVVREAIQSGMLIDRHAFEECGLFDERLVIDLVDSEFCVRCRKLGWASVVGRGTWIIHSLGDPYPVNFFGIPVRRHGRLATYESHSPLRHYYIVRNTVDLALRYARDEPRWVASLLKRQAFDMTLAVAAGPQRLKQAVAELIGGVHGLGQRRGRIPSGLERFLAGRDR